jgi:putative nucleotidyltransferase with HDIG domain
MSLGERAAPEMDRHDMVKLLGALLASPSYRPPMLPGVAMEIMQLAQQPSVQFEEVVAVLEKDPVLAARVLSISQSAFYAPRSPIRSLTQAAVRLGLKTLRDLVLEASLHLRVFRVPGYEKPMERLARHSTATAHVVRLVCRRSMVDAEYAFLCGLLHDVGFSACLLALAEDPHWRQVPFDDLAPVLDEVHEEASGVLARQWKLSEQIQQVVGSHHSVTVDGTVRPVNAAVIVAEQLAWEAGAGLLPAPEDADPLATSTPEPPLEGLDANWTGVVEEARKALELDGLGLCALRAETFALLDKLGLSGPRKGRSEAGAPGSSPPGRPAARR